MQRPWSWRTWRSLHLERAKVGSLAKQQTTCGKTQSLDMAWWEVQPHGMPGDRRDESGYGWIVKGLGDCVKEDRGNQEPGGQWEAVGNAQSKAQALPDRGRRGGDWHSRGDHSQVHQCPQAQASLTVHPWQEHLDGRGHSPCSSCIFSSHMTWEHAAYRRSLVSKEKGESEPKSREEGAELCWEELPAVRKISQKCGKEAWSTAAWPRVASSVHGWPTFGWQMSLGERGLWSCPSSPISHGDRYVTYPLQVSVFSYVKWG